jgi:hypothetical protein
LIKNYFTNNLSGLILSELLLLPWSFFQKREKIQWG